MNTRSILAVVVALTAVAGSVTAAPSEAARREIASLIGALDGSSCRFQRNGSWHDAAEARAHLQRKYDYLLKKDKVDTAEQFIERAASQSSMSGKPYRIAGRRPAAFNAVATHRLRYRFPHHRWRTSP